MEWGGWGLSSWVDFWLLRRFLRQAPRRRKPPPQSENAMVETRRESQDIAELKAEVSTLKPHRECTDSFVADGRASV